MANVTNTEARLYTVDGVQLIPGLNTVDDAVWAQAKKHPLVQARLKDGRLKEDTSSAQDEPKADDKGQQPNGDANKGQAQTGGNQGNTPAK